MTSLPRYTGEENLRRIKMDKEQIFILVEGVDDVPIFGAAIHELTGCDFENMPWNVIHADGKKNIIKFASRESCGNFISIIDRDFDNCDLGGDRVVVLRRYSVENYFFCKKVLSYAASFKLGVAAGEIYDSVSFSEAEEHYNDRLKTLFDVIKNYQLYAAQSVADEDQISWSDRFIFEERSWRVSQERVDNLRAEVMSMVPEDKLLPSDDFDMLAFFPGKMLMEGVRKYFNEKLESLGLPRGFQDLTSFKNQVKPCLCKSSEFVEDISEVIVFLESKKCA